MINYILTLVIVSQFSPMPKLDSKLSWRTLESEHFAIHFSNQYDWQMQEQFAQEIVNYCENGHRLLMPFMRGYPKQRTNIVIGDFFDYVSGWATPFPHNTIFICPTFDRDMRVNYADWLQQLIIHEYTHILNMDMDYGIPKFFRKIFGRIIVPNTVIPLFMQEGFSVYNESKFTGLGRSSSKYYQMMMRTKILTDRFFPIDKCVTYDLAQFPAGETPYFYGSQFYQYLTTQYGDSLLTKYANWLSGGLPLLYNTQAKRVFGKSLYALWQDFKQHSFQEYNSQIKVIQDKSVTKTIQITESGFNTQAPVFKSDNTKIYYLSKTNHDYPSLQEFDLVNKKTRTLLKKNISSLPSISQDDSKLIISIRDYYKNAYYFDDLYEYDLTNKHLTRLTQGLRASDPDFSPADTALVFVQTENGQSNLYLMNLQTREILPLTQNENLTQYSNPRFSPDGKSIAVAVWKHRGEQDIYIYDIKTEWFKPITEDRFLDIEPCWTKDSQYLLFSSDRTGVFNIYAYHLETGKLYQITNVLTGAFTPVISNDNQQILCQVYSEKGFDIHMLQVNFDELNQSDALSVAESETTTYSQDSILTGINYPSRYYYYNQYPSILPKFWLPVVMYEHREKWSYGALTYGADALFQHQYLLQAFYNPQTKKPNIYFNYTLDKFKPTILFNADYEYQRLQGNIASRYSFLKNDYQHYLTGSYYFDYKYNLDNGFGLFYQFNNTKFYRTSISLEQGRYLGIQGELYDKLFLSNSQKAGVSLVFAEYLKLPLPNHVLMLNAKIGFTFSGYFYTIGKSNASFIIRGANQRYSAHNGISLITEYRLPVFWIERGLGTLPIFFRNISAAAFFDIGKLYERFHISNNFYPVLKGAGLELSLGTLCFYQLPVNFVFGIATDLSKAKISQYYFQIKHTIPFVNDTQIKANNL